MTANRNLISCALWSFYSLLLVLQPSSVFSSSSSGYSSHSNNDKDLVSAPSAYAKQVKRDDQPKFSIGLGTLSPSYTQKLGPDGKTMLDFNTDKNGFSYSISNVNHQSSLTQSGSENKATKDPGHIDQNLKNHNLNPYNYYQNPGSPNINVYHQQGYSAYPQQVNALAQMYGAGAPGFNQPSGPGLLPFSGPGQQGGQYYPGQPGGYPGGLGSNGFFQPNNGYTSNISPNQGNNSPTTAASSTKPEAKEDAKSSSETTTSSPSSGQLNTLPGGIFNYGFSQNHGMAPQGPVNYPMNYPINPYFGASGGPANQANVNGVTSTAINHGSGANPALGSGPAGMNGMYGSPYGFGMDPYSMAAMSGYGGGPSDAYSGYGGYGGNGGLGGSGMMGSASSPYASLFPFL